MLYDTTIDSMDHATFAYVGRLAMLGYLFDFEAHVLAMRLIALESL